MGILIKPTITITLEAEDQETSTSVYRPGEPVGDNPEILTHEGVRLIVDRNRVEMEHDTVAIYTKTTIEWTTVRYINERNPR